MLDSERLTVEHHLRELCSLIPRDRATMLYSLGEAPPTDPSVILACERLLEDRTLAAMGIPHRFGEIRALAAETVWSIRVHQGIDKPVVVPGVLDVCTTNQVAALVRQAGIPMVSGGVEGVLATFAKLVAADQVPRHDIHLETVASKIGKD